jgi:hypothetical protein
MIDLLKSDTKTSSCIPELTNNNWLEWINLLKDILESHSLLEYTESIIILLQKEEDKKLFRKEDAKAKAIIKIAVGTIYCTYLIGLETSKAYLDKLHAVYKTTSSKRI